MAMFLLTSMRGLDSTGMAGINLRQPNPEPSLVKIVGNPFNLYDFEHTKEFNRRFLSEFTTVIGHCRAATKGVVNAKNAHPFMHGDVTLVHNGTLTNFEELRKKYNMPKIEVDSELICALFNEYNVKEIIEELEGAFTLVWFDTSDNTFNFVRNYQRPLFIGTINATNTILLASERSTLEWSASKYNLVFSSIESVPAFKWHKYSVGSLKPEIIEIAEPKVTYTTPVGGYGARGYYPALDDDNDVWGTDQSVTTKSVDGDNCSIDNHLAGKYADGTNVLERGDKILVDIIDYDYKEIKDGEITTFKGATSNYPRTTFLTTFVRRVDESEFYEGNTKLEGEVHRVKTEWVHGVQQDTVILIKPHLVNLVEQEEEQVDGNTEWFDIESYYGRVRLTQQRLEHLIKNSDCEWCMRPHKPFSRKTAKDLIYVPAEGSTDGNEALVCYSCSINSRTKHHRH